MNATALVAEDEPLLAANLQAELAQLWPDLRIVANVRHGAAAIDQALVLQPDVVFLDIHMPGMTGLEAAEAITEDWPEKLPLLLLVFVTEYEQYAQAGVGPAIHMVPIGRVLYFEAADKYVRVVTAERDHLIRTSLRELLPQLDPHRFWQIRRGTVVRSDATATALPEECGKVQITLRGPAGKLVVSRLYAHLFRQM